MSDSNGRGRPWTDYDKDELRRLAAMPESTVPFIANRLGRTDAAIAGKMNDLGIRLARSLRQKNDAIDNFLLNGEVLTFAVTDRPCARCAVRETEHYRHGCGQFAAEVRVRLK